VYFDKAIPSCARKYTVFSATIIALSSLVQTLLTEVERLDLSFGAMMAFWWSALAACLE
jgi:ribose/xylose/arabinose/galactoside ABC-type transport system permease subunit